MPNQVPLTGAAQAAGGYLILPEYAAETLVSTVLQENGIAQLAQRQVLRGRQKVFTTFLGTPMVGFVGEGALKPLTGAEWGQVTVGIKELAAIVPFTNQLIEDAREDPMLLVTQRVEQSIANVVDQHALGMANGVGVTSQFANALAATTQTVEFDGTRPDALAYAMSRAQGVIEGNGGRASGALLSWTFRQHIREARLGGTPGDAQPVYAAQQAGLDPFQGIGNIAFSTNLSNVNAAAGAGKIVGIVGDFANYALLLIRNDIAVSRSAEATLDNGGTLIHLWQQNMQAVRWDVRVGFYAHDLNRQFCAIIDAA